MLLKELKSFKKKNMKRMLLIGVVLLIGLSSHSQSKQVYCNFYEEVLDPIYSGVDVDYTSTTLEITIPIAAFAKEAQISITETRKLLRLNSSMDLIGEVFVGELRSERKTFNEQGFYYIMLRIKDTYSYDYKLYSTRRLKI